MHNTFWVLTAILAVVSADVGLGYHYNVPQTSYGVPSYQYSASSSHDSSDLPSGSYGNSGHLNYKAQTGHGGYQGSTVSQHSVFEIPHTTVQSGSVHGISGLHHSPSFTSSGRYGHYYPSIASSSSESSNTVRPIYNSFAGDSSHSGSSSYKYNHHQSNAAHKYQQYYVQQQPAQVYKHFFVHTAPEELELPKPRTPIVLPPPQKHYKIIFVKTPSHTRTQQVIEVPQQHEEKTIVYVLSKKEDELHDILVPKIENKPPTKPEVYFVKYKNKEDSQSVINDIVNDYNKGQGHSVSFSGLEDASGDDFHSSSLGSFDTTSHDIVDSFPVYSTGSYNLPSYSQEKHKDHYSASPIKIHEHGSDFVTETYGINKESSRPQTFTLGTADTHVVNLAEASTTSHGSLISGNNIVSTTTSSLAPDNTNIISTSQGVPHETYGPPNFRPV